SATTPRDARPCHDDRGGRDRPGHNKKAARAKAAPLRLCAGDAPYLSWSATLSMPALAQTSSLSPPGAPDTPIAPMVSSPTLIGSAPWAGTMLVSRSAPAVGLSLIAVANSPDGRRWAFDVKAFFIEFSRVWGPVPSPRMATITSPLRPTTLADT